MSVLVVAEHLRGELRPITLELITAAGELGGPTTVAVIAKDPSRLTDDVNRASVDEIVTVSVEPEEFESDVYQAALEALIQERRPTVTLLGFTVNSMGFAPAVATKLDLGFASDVFAVRSDGGSLVAERAFYGSKVHAEVEFPGKEEVLLLLRPTTWAPAEGTGGATVSDFPVTIARSPQGVRGGRRRRRRHHDVGLPPLGRARDWREGKPPALRAARGQDGSDVVGLA